MVTEERQELAKNGAEENQVLGKQSTDDLGATGRWTNEEHQRFLEAYNLYGKNWKLVQKHIGTRNAAQARSHAQKYFAKLERGKNIDNLKTQECTPLSSPISGPITENQAKIQTQELPKEPENIKRLLTYSEDLSLEPVKKHSTVSSNRSNAETSNLKVFENFQEEDIDKWFNFDSDLPSYQSMPVLMNMRYGNSNSMFAPWERELDIESFQMRIANSPFSEGSRPILRNTEEELHSNDYLSIPWRSRTLSSVFE